LIEPMMAPMIDEMKVLRRQMVDEFQQARTMMVETFTTLHQEQWALLNREVEQLGQISQELQKLRDQIQQQTQLDAEQVKSIAAPNPQKTRLGSAAPPSAPIVATAFVTHPEKGGNGAHTTVIHPENNSNGESTPRPRIIPAVPSRFVRVSAVGLAKSNGTASQSLEASEPDSRTKIDLDPLPSHDREAHLQLFERIVRDEGKRQSRWRKLLNLLPGAIEGGSTL
jgi:hypothetical protein